MANIDDHLAGLVREPAPKTGYPPGELIRLLGSLEYGAYKCTSYQSANTVQAVWLTSDDPIDPNDVREAVREVALKSEILQTCVRKTFFRYWAKKMNHFVCDFATTNKDPMEAFYELAECSFDMKNGPLWKVRLALPSTNSAGEQRTVLLLCLHHLMTDGTTNLLICRDILSILNAKKKNQKLEIPFRPVERPVDVLVNRWNLRNHLDMFCLVLKVLWSTFIFPWKNPFCDLNPGGPMGVGKLELCMHTFSDELTRKIAKRCKENEVTVNCFIIATAKIALLKLIKNYRANCRAASIITENIANMRRYLDPQEQELHGFWASGHFIELTVTDEDLQSYESLWELARKVKSLQASALQNRIPAQRIPQYRFMHLASIFNKLMNTLQFKNFELCHIAANNLGDLSKAYFHPEKFDVVKVDDFLRSTSFPYFPMLHSLLCHTLKGKLTIVFEHYGNKNPKQVTENMLKYMVQFITSLAEQNSL